MIEGILYPITGHHLLFALLDCLQNANYLRSTILAFPYV